MDSTLSSSLLIIGIISGIPGITMCSFILMVYIRHWKESRNLGICDKIQFVIILTNVLLQVILTVDCFLELFDICLTVEQNIFLFIVMLQNVLIDVSFWNTAWLSIFYSIRLVKILPRVLLEVVTRFTSSVLQLITGSLFFSIIINMPVLWTGCIDVPRNNTSNPMYCGYVITWSYTQIIISSVIRFSLPCSLTCACIGLSVTALLRHVQRMKKTESHVTSDQLKGHVRAIRSMSLRVVLDIAFYVAITTQFFLLLSSVNYMLQFTCWLFILFYPMVQCLIIVHGNPRFRSRLCGHSSSS